MSKLLLEFALPYSVLNIYKMFLSPLYWISFWLNSLLTSSAHRQSSPRLDLQLDTLFHFLRYFTSYI